MLHQILAIEVTPTALRCLRLRPMVWGGGPPTFTEHALPPGLVVPALETPNVQDERAFGQALAAAVGPRPPRGTRLVLPDGAAVLALRRLPPRGTRQQQGPAIRRAYAPAHAVRPAAPRVLALASGERVLHQYERLLGAAGIAVCHMAPAAWHLFHQATRGARPGDTAVLALGRTTSTLLRTHAGAPIAVQTLPPATDPAGLVQAVQARLAHAAAIRGLAPPARLLMAGEASTGPVRAALEQGLGRPCPAHVLGARQRGSAQLPAAAQAVLAAALAGTPQGLVAHLPASRGARCTPVCAPPGGRCPRECRGAFLRTVATGVVLAAALTLAGSPNALASADPPGEARGALALPESAATADQRPQVQDEDAAETQDLHSPPMGAAEDANDAPQQSANQTAAAPWPPWQTWR